MVSSQSVVKLPNSLDRTDPAVVDTVNWTAALDKVFIKNRGEDPSIRYIYRLHEEYKLYVNVSTIATMNQTEIECSMN